MAAPTEAGDSRRTVMIAIDGSKQAEEAFDWYAQFIHRNENHVILVHAPECAEVTQAVKDKLSDSEIQKMIAKEKKEMDEMQNKYSTKLKQHPNVNNYEYKTAYGAKPGEALVNTAEEVKADMVIMGTRGLGTIRRTIMGSVSDYVVHHAHCPVIVCRH